MTIYKGCLQCISDDTPALEPGFRRVRRVSKAPGNTPKTASDNISFFSSLLR